MSKIASPIGNADMEFYYGGIVRRMAIFLSGQTDDSWETISSKRRNRWLDKATVMACNLFNDDTVVDGLSGLAANLRGRK
jgi:hypothetical protein